MEPYVYYVGGLILVQYYSSEKLQGVYVGFSAIGMVEILYASSTVASTSTVVRVR